jgi:hypothetical protein
MTPEERIESYIKLSTNLLEQLHQLSRLHEQMRQVDVAVGRKEGQSDNSSSGAARDYKRHHRKESKV